MKTPENPKAFPLVESSDGQWPAQYGMTLRDYFAAKVLPQCVEEFWGTNRDDSGGMETAAECAYQIADAMLKAREPKGAA